LESQRIVLGDTPQNPVNVFKPSYCIALCHPWMVSHFRQQELKAVSKVVTGIGSSIGYQVNPWLG